MHDPFLIFHALLALLILVDRVKSAPHEHANSSVISQKTFESNIIVHGILLWASMGFLMPIGILIIRISTTSTSNHTRRHKILINLHAIFQVLSVLLVTAGAILSIQNFDNAFNNAHQKIGLALYAAVYLQILIGFRRIKRGSRGRVIWYMTHWILGTATSLVATLNMYTGLHAYHNKTSKSTTFWSIILTAQLSFMAIFYVLQDKWDYILHQGVVHSDGPQPQEIRPQVETQKDITVNEPTTTKSNALGAYFSRNNALDKLFQLT